MRHGHRRQFALGILMLLCVAATRVWADAKPPVYLWLEPEWFPEVTGGFSYSSGPGTVKPTGNWMVAGPGISAEWSQGGESEWNSMGVVAEETKAQCHRDIVVPRAGHYRVWVRYVDHRDAASPFTVQVRQGGKTKIAGELGVKHAVSRNDEFELYWGFSFAWAAVEGDLEAGPASVHLIIDKAGQSWRQVDAILITDDPAYVPVGREKPGFAYFKAFDLRPADEAGAAWRGSAKGLPLGSTWGLKPIAGRDFTMWTDVSAEPKWWAAQNPASVTPYDAFYHFAPPADIKDEFHKQFAGRKDMPIMSWPGLVPGFYLGESPDLSPDTNLYKWLVASKTPFYMMTNYANPVYKGMTGPATYKALSGPLAGQFLGYIHGESVGTLTVPMPTDPAIKDRRAQVDHMGQGIAKAQAAEWSKFYKTAVPESYRAKSIPCISCDATALAHLFHETGCDTVGYEVDSTNVHVPMRIAFERGAARQYGGSWINYASSNFGDSCNEFTQEPNGPRGAKAWYVNKYAITDGVSAAWYRRLYYANYLGGAGAIFWEQGLGNQWMLPGPGKHPIGLSPFGRATTDFQDFVSRLPDRGQPYTPIAFLLSYGNGYDRCNYTCKMLNIYPEDANDLELRELFNVAWFPSPVLEGEPQAPDVQSMPSGVYGNIFDVLVDRPAKMKAIMGYPVVWAAGDVDLNEAVMPVVEEYVKKGGTLVVNVEQVKNKAIARLTGLKLSGVKEVSEGWNDSSGEFHATTPAVVETATPNGATVLAYAMLGPQRIGRGPNIPLITRNAVGQGAVITTLVPHMIGQDERAHPALVYLMNAITQGLLPVEVVTLDGKPLTGEVQVNLNKTKDGWLVGLLNNRGVDKTPSGIARVDRRQYADVMIRTKLKMKGAKEYVEPRDLAVEKKGEWETVKVRVEAGDVAVVGVRE